MFRLAAGHLTYEGTRDALDRMAAQTAIMKWLSGESRPNNEMRARIWGAFGVPVESWNRAPELPTNGAAKPEVVANASANTSYQPPPALANASHPPLTLSSCPPPPAAVATIANGVRPSTLDQCLSVLDTLRAARAVPNLIASEQIKLADAEGRMLALRMRLERDAERAEDRIVREHPEWHRLKRLIVKTLAAHPAALKDLAAAIGETLEGSE